MDGDVGRSAERAVRMGIGAVGMGVRDLHRTRNRHQKHADQRKEYPPTAAGALSETSSSHTRTIAQMRYGWQRQENRRSAGRCNAA